MNDEMKNEMKFDPESNSENVENKNFDPEKEIYEIYGKLQKADLFKEWETLSSRTMKYFEHEWGYENPPNIDEITKVCFQNVNEGVINKFCKSISEEEMATLLSFMIIGFDEIINGTSKKTV